MEKREDLRITKTKRDLREALTELMKTTPLKKITVADICSAAMVNRMTFYKHYDDKYELLNDVLMDIKQSIIRELENSSPAADAPSRELDIMFRLLDLVVEECLKRKDILSAVNNDDLVIAIITNTMEKAVYELLEGFSSVYKFKYSLNMLSAAITGATTFLIWQWIIHEPEETKAEFLRKSKAFLADIFASKILVVTD